MERSAVERLDLVGVEPAALAAEPSEGAADRALGGIPVDVVELGEVALVALARSDETAEAADRAFEDLCAAGIEVLYDDRRDVSPGVKFKDADLRGLPLRVVIGDRSLEAGGAELSHRGVRENRLVPLDELAAEIRSEIDALMEPLTLAP